jgi:hypothetical protein
VNAVAIHAIRYGGVTDGKALAVVAGQILGQLIDPLAGIVLVHQAGITMAAGAKLRHGRARDLAAETTRGAHCCLGLVALRVAAVAVSAAEAVPLVDIARELSHRVPLPTLERAMAFDAGILCRQTN